MQILTVAPTLRSWSHCLQSSCCGNWSGTGGWPRSVVTSAFLQYHVLERDSGLLPDKTPPRSDPSVRSL